MLPRGRLGHKRRALRHRSNPQVLGGLYARSFSVESEPLRLLGQMQVSRDAFPSWSPGRANRRDLRAYVG